MANDISLRSHADDEQTLPRLAYSVSEAAQVSGLGRTTLYSLIGAGKLLSIKIGNRRVIRRVDLERILNPETAAA